MHTFYLLSNFFLPSFPPSYHSSSFPSFLPSLPLFHHRFEISISNDEKYSKSFSLFPLSYMKLLRKYPKKNVTSILKISYLSNSKWYHLLLLLLSFTIYVNWDFSLEHCYMNNTNGVIILPSKCKCAHLSLISQNHRFISIALPSSAGCLREIF